MEQGKRIVIYGAGNYCRLLLNGGRLSSWEIVGVVDGASQKWGTRMEQYPIKRPDEIGNLSYDKILIAAREYKGIAERLVLELQIPEPDILYYDFDHNQMHGLEDSGLVFRKGNTAVAEKALFRQMAIRTIQEGLLFEALGNGEFAGYRSIVVVGAVPEFRIVRQFFQGIPGMAGEVRMEDTEQGISAGEKYILTGPEYLEELERLKKRKGFTLKQCLVLPLWDVEDTVLV